MRNQKQQARSRLRAGCCARSGCCKCVHGSPLALHVSGVAAAGGVSAPARGGRRGRAPRAPGEEYSSTRDADHARRVFDSLRFASPQ